MGEAEDETASAHAQRMPEMCKKKKIKIGEYKEYQMDNRRIIIILSRFEQMKDYQRRDTEESRGRPGWDKR